MKRTHAFSALTFLALTLLIACSGTGRKALPHADVAGTWRLDSILSKNGTNDELPMFLIALAAGDSTPVTYTFTGDSLLAANGDGVFESTAYRYEKPMVHVLDSSGERLEVIRPADSSLVLRTRDSARMFFTRQ